jgi:xanthine dehydrogenase accessory factor
MAYDVHALADELRRKGEPFALATVVRCVRPTSAKPGAKAIIYQDGTVSGWIGGSCAEPIIAKEGRQALRDGQPRFVALIGPAGSDPGRREGVLEYPMTCHSGGTIEIFVEPVLPRLQLLIVGRGPVVETLVKLGKVMEFDVSVVPSEPSSHTSPPISETPHAFIVVVSHGAFDEEALEQSLRSKARYVSLVASRKRAGAIVETLRGRGVPAERLTMLKAPAGLDIGAVTPDEIAASILAEIIQVSRHPKGDRHREDTDARESGAAQTRDPVCGMLVDVAAAKHRSEISGTVFYFCCAGCKRSFDEDSERYAGAAARLPTR